MTTATAYASFPCPDCHKLISYEGRDIHLCVTRLKIGRKTFETSREYVGYYDAYRVCGKSDNHAVEIELDRYIADLQAAGLDRTATELDGGDPEAVELVEPATDAPCWRPVITCECVACETVQPCYYDQIAESYICIDRTACDARAAELDARYVPADLLASAERSAQRALDEAVARMERPAPKRPPAVPISVSQLHQLRGTNTAAFRARLAGLSPAELDTEARVYAAYDSLTSGKVVSAEQTLAYFRQQVALHRSGAVPAPIPDDLSPVLFELSLTDIPALAELLREHSDIQREQLAWRFAGWLRREHDIRREWTFILKGWQALIVGASASGVAGTDRAQARPGEDKRGQGVEHGPSTNGRSTGDYTTEARR